MGWRGRGRECCGQVCHRQCRRPVARRAIISCPGGTEVGAAAAAAGAAGGNIEQEGVVGPCVQALGCDGVATGTEVATSIHA